MWLGDGYEAMVEAAEKEGDAGALAALRGHASVGKSLDLALFSKTLARRATLVREWGVFLETFAVIVMPVCAELPFADQLDIKDEASFKRVWRAHLPQIALPSNG